MPQIYFEDFEAGFDYTVSGTGDAGRKTDGAITGTYSGYVAERTVTADSPVVDAASPDITLNYDARCGSNTIINAPESGENLEVYYLNDTGSWVLVATHDPATWSAGEIRSFSHSLSADAEHTGFRVRFRLTGGSGANFDYWWFDSVEVTTDLAVSTDAATSISAGSATLNGTITTGTETDVWFEWRSVGSQTWTTTPIQTVLSSASFSETVSLNSLTDYEFRAQAATTGGSASTTGATLSFSSLSLTPVRLDWTDNATDEYGFYVYRTTTATPSFPADYSQIDTLGFDVVTYTDEYAPEDATVHYAVTAYNGGGESVEVSASITTSTGGGGTPQTAAAEVGWLTSSTPTTTAVAGGVGVLTSTASMPVSAPDATSLPGAVSADALTASLTASASPTTVSIGYLVGADVGAVALSGPALTAIPSSVAATPETASIVLDVPATDAIPGEIFAGMTPGVGLLSAETVDVTPGITSASADTGALTVGFYPIISDSGYVIGVEAASTALSAPETGILPGNVAADAGIAELTATTVALEAIPGAVAPEMGVSTLATQVIAPQALAGPVSTVVVPASLLASATTPSVAVGVAARNVLMAAATAAVSAGASLVAPGPIGVPVGAASGSVSAPEAVGVPGDVLTTPDAVVLLVGAPDVTWQAVAVAGVDEVGLALSSVEPGLIAGSVSPGMEAVDLALALPTIVAESVLYTFFRLSETGDTTTALDGSENTVDLRPKYAFELDESNDNSA